MHSSSYVKDFDSWNVLKKKINRTRNKPPFYSEREIWWVTMGVNVGYEEDGKNINFLRPVLVLKKFNQMLFLGIPMSSKLKNNKYYLEIYVKNKNVSLLLSQVRVFSSNRLQCKLSKISISDYLRIKKYLLELIFYHSPLRDECRD